MSMHDPRAGAGQRFKRMLARMLALGDQHQDATEIFIDGERVALSFGNREEVYRLADFDLDLDAIEAACDAAAVFANVEFGPGGKDDPAEPSASVKIPPDLRVTFVRPPLADEWHMAIRFLRSRKLTLEDYVRQEVMTAAQAAFIRRLLGLEPGATKFNLVISGSTGTGKTTLLRAILLEVLERERVIIAEDTPELAVSGRNVVQLRTTAELGLGYVLKRILRMTPDRIVVGELLDGPAAVVAVRAMNTGHDGTFLTVHSNGLGQTVDRIFNLARSETPGMVRAEVEMGVDFVLHLEGKGSDRRLASIHPVSERARAFR